MVVATAASREIAVATAAIATTTATPVSTTCAAAGITAAITGQANDGLERGHEESRGQPAQQALPS
jgi:hypothetical protein